MSSLTSFILLAIIFVTGTKAGEKNLPLVKTPLGTIGGTIKESIDGKRFNAFEGVPYAKPPLGNYRFQEPSEVEPWTGTWQANTIHKCLQYKHFTYEDEVDRISGEEDCLYLNIYTPTLDKSANLDVIVYIHGGAFMFFHSGLFGPEILLNRNIVFVNFNYRLGPLGFLSTEDDVVPGNNGLKDQIAALNWIKSNIEYFGGNPNSITIAGNSAGGASVHLHYLMPKSRGLFHRGISLSGSALNPWVLMEAPLQKAKKVAEIVGCSSASNKNMVECLKTRSGRQIVETVAAFQPWLYNPFSPFAIVVDRWSSNPLLPDHPYNLMKNKQVYAAPWIVSHTNSEGLYPGAEFYEKDQHFEDLETRWDEILPHILHYNFTIKPGQVDVVGQKIRKFYLKDKKMSKETFGELIQLIGDRLFVVDIEKSARLQAAATTAPVFLYYYTYRGTRSISEWGTKTNNDFGASHGDDLISIVKLDQMDTHVAENDRKVSNLLVDIWLSMAKEGKPKVPSVEWPSISRKMSDEIAYLKIAGPDKLKIESKTELGHRKFWDSLELQENEKLLVVKDEL